MIPAPTDIERNFEASESVCTRDDDSGLEQIDAHPRAPWSG
ncbi:hypothetical protein [Agromyces humatus]|nr:hypothetical protein [Agromyces humatus]